MTKKLTNEQKKEKKDARKQQKAPSTTVVKVTQPKHEGPAEPAADPVNLCDDCAYEFGECEGKPKFASDQDKTLTGSEADRVVECPAFVNVSKMPTVQEVTAGHGAAAEEKPAEGPRKCNVEHLRDYPGCFVECDKDKCDGVPAVDHAGGDEGPAEAYHCPYGCRFSIPSGARWDNPDIGGCAVEDKIPPEFRYENDPSLPTCPEYKVTAASKEESEPEVKVIRTDLPERPDPKRFQAEEDFGTCQSCQRPLKRTAFNRYHDAVRCTNPRCRAYRAIVKAITTGVK